MSSSTINLKALGLNFSPNNLELPAGSLVQADNIIIRRDDIIESRRGFKLFGEQIPEDVLAKQILVYRDRILRHYSDRIAFQDGVLNNGDARFTPFGGNFLETKPGLRIKGLQAQNGNFYFTSIDGIKKISAADANEFVAAETVDPDQENYIATAGGIKALDLNADLIISPANDESFLPENSAVAYKIVWGSVDANKVEGLGTPSERVVVRNPASDLLKVDFQRLLILLDNLKSTSPLPQNSLIDDGDYVSEFSSVINDSTFYLRQAAIDVAKKIDEDLNFVSGTGISATSDYESLKIIKNKEIVTSYSTTSDQITPTSVADLKVGMTVRNKDINAKITAINISTSKITIDTLPSGNGTNVSTIFSGVGVNLGEVTIAFSDDGAEDYFSVGDLVNLTNFKSNSEEIQSLNGTQIIQSVSSGAGYSSITFTNREYTLSNSVGISGFIQSYTASSGGKVTITTTEPHGLSTGQKIWISKTGQADLDSAPLRVEVSGPETFLVGAASVVAGTSGIWDIYVDVTSDSTNIIESYKYRSIAAPSEISILQPNGTASQTASLRSYISTIIDNLKTEKTEVIKSSLASDVGLTDFTQTTTASVRLEFTVPFGITSGYFYRIYRSQILEGILSDDPSTLEPSPDYFFLTEEAYLVDKKTNRNTIIYLDSNVSIVDPFNESLKLYTSNSATGDQDPNDYPPFAHDVTLFKDYAIYASTKLKQIKGMTLLGVSLIKDDIRGGETPKLLIADNTGNNQTVYEFVEGKQEILTISVPSTAAVTYGGYFTLDVVGSGVEDNNGNYKYCFWYSNGTTTAPSVADVDEYIEVYIDVLNNAGVIANKTAAALNSISSDVSCTVASTTVGTITDYTITVTYKKDGFLLAPFAASGLTNITASVSTAGVGESSSVASPKVALPSSNLITPEQQTILTLKSLARVINRVTSDSTSQSDVYCYYDSQLQGDFTLEGIFFKDEPFYTLANTNNLGQSFTPVLSSLGGANATSDGTKITLTISNHGFLNNEEIVIFNVKYNPNFSGGVYPVTVVNVNTVTINSTITLSESELRTFSYQKAKNISKSDNFRRKNRLYYSKAGVPEAVFNNIFTGSFQDIGSEEKEILRVFPLRESLFVFKEDGLYRLSGTSAPFNEALFDSSCILTAPDSVAVSGNIIYAWTRQGITVISESGTSLASRPIDIEILKLGSVNYTNFKTATFGVGYESDNSYVVWTVSKVTDEVATQAFRYSSLTNTWTKYTKTNTCGLVNPLDDVLYLGAGDINYLEQERKAFSREDYSDREYDYTIGQGSINGTVINLSNIENISVGDSFVQSQIITVYNFNSLLKKLDSDPNIVASEDDDFYETLGMSSGQNLRTKLVSLAEKLDNLSAINYLSTIDSKTGTISSVSLEYPLKITSANHGLFTGRVISISNSTSSPTLDGEFVVTVIDNNTFSINIELDSFSGTADWSTSVQNIYDVAACYNKIIDFLNADTITAYSNYQQIDNISILESAIIGINRINKTITLRRNLPFVQGNIKIYQAINNVVVYSPNSFGSALTLKQIREATLMFLNNAFTSVTLGFSSDLLPAFIDIEFDGDGKGLFGNDEFGENFFGGSSHSAPLRTYIPKQCQRCRFLNVKFSHRNAREQYALLGITLTGRSVSTRAYR